MASISLPTKNQFAFTHALAPNGDEIITIGQSIFIRNKDTSEWTHETLSDYFSGHIVLADEEKHDDVQLPRSGIESHFFTTSGVEMIVANNLLFFRVYPTEKTWHVTDNKEPVAQNKKRLIISPIANVALEQNKLFVDSGDVGFSFRIEELAIEVPNQITCKSCLQTFQTVPLVNATIICTFCGCPEIATQW